uniref:Uncharacterized protein n=1 Tax=Ditylenchus dipsaci TaxID=166011 RepID=A0A915EJ26_9BILA
MVFSRVYPLLRSPIPFGKRESTFRPLQFGKKSEYRPLQFGKRGSAEGGSELVGSSLGPSPPNLHHRQLHLQLQSAAGARRLLGISPNQHYFSFVDGQGYYN